MNKITHKKGFTLVEIMVSLMIFSLVVVVALAALVKIVDANRKAQTIQDAVINLSFTMEAFTRELRTGSSLYCATLAGASDLTITSIASSQCPVGHISGTNFTVALAFLSNRMDGICRLINAYEFQPSPTWTWLDQSYIIKKALQPSCGAPLVFTPLFSDKSVTIKSFSVNISHGNNYPLVSTMMQGMAGNSASGQTTFSLQTAASPRVP